MTEQRFTDNGDGTVTDNETGLTWQQDDDGMRRNWEDAKVHCKGLSIGSHTDWRLPTVKELVSIVDYGRCNPAIDTTFFPETRSSYYWSATTNALYTDCAWHVNFYYGFDSNDDKSGAYCVRAVRGGQEGLRAEVERLRAENKALMHKEGGYLLRIVVHQAHEKRACDGGERALERIEELEAENAKLDKECKYMILQRDDLKRVIKSLWAENAKLKARLNGGNPQPSALNCSKCGKQISVMEMPLGVPWDTMVCGECSQRGRVKP